VYRFSVCVSFAVEHFTRSDRRVTSSSRRGTDEVFALLGCYAALICICRAFGTAYRLTRNVVSYLLINAAYYYRRPNNSYNTELISYEGSSIKYECVSLSLSYLSGMQIASFLRLGMLSSMACLDVPYLSTLSHKRCVFLKQDLLNTKSVFWFSLQLSSETSFVLFVRRRQRDIVMKVHR
jgi:hypothetical protein